MSFYDVLARGDDEIARVDGPPSYFKNLISHITCGIVVGGSKLILDSLYNVRVSGIDNIDHALADARTQGRSVLTLMNHMSVCDDPMLWACLPWKFYKHLDDIRWGLAATNVCFTNMITRHFFALGKILPCERFGRGIQQPALDACVRVLSPDETLDADHIYHPKNVALDTLVPPSMPSRHDFLNERYTAPMLRKKTSWLHIFPEGFVCQLEAPFNNSMRFFHWGIARLILEPTVAPIVVPIFSDGFEKIKPEHIEEKMIDFFHFSNLGSEVTVNIGPRLDQQVIESFREEWKKLCKKHEDPQNPAKISKELMFGDEAKELRHRVTSYVRDKMSDLRSVRFGPEDPRFKSMSWWEEYTKTEGKSDPEVKLIGLNWANKIYQKNVDFHDENGRLVGKGSRPS